MNSKWHLILSFIKSGIRILGCFIVLLMKNWDSLLILVFLFLIAEIIGVIEEMGDNR